MYYYDIFSWHEISVILKYNRKTSIKGLTWHSFMYMKKFLATFELFCVCWGNSFLLSMKFEWIYSVLGFSEALLWGTEVTDYILLNNTTWSRILKRVSAKLSGEEWWWRWCPLWKVESLFERNALLLLFSLFKWNIASWKLPNFTINPKFCFCLLSALVKLTNFIRRHTE